MITKTALKQKFQNAYDILRYHWIQRDWFQIQGNRATLKEAKQSNKACKMCLDGAFKFVCATKPNCKLDSGYNAMTKVFNKVIVENEYEGVIGYNDRDTTTKKDVLKSLKKCIKSLS